MKNIKILIPNATGPTNIGDQAILKGLIKVLRSVYKNPEFIIHSSEHKKYHFFLSKSIKPTLYSWSVLDNTNPLQRIYKLTLLALNYLLLKLNFPVVGPKMLKNLLADFKGADLILFVGGGYLRSKAGLSQLLNLLMILTVIKFSTLVKTKKVLAPISFGPFAFAWQERLAAEVLKPIDTIFVREKYSHKAIKKYGLNPILCTDSALFLPVKKHYKNKRFVLGFTVRNWLKEDKQKDFETNVAQAIFQFAKNLNLLVQPIIHVDAPKYGDYDKTVTQNIVLILHSQGLKTLKPQKITTLDQGLKIYSKLDMLLGMRMHSNIMAALVGVPFVAIAYEYKTEGICKSLGVSNCVIKVQDLTQERLLTLLNDLYKNYAEISSLLAQNLKKLQFDQQAIFKRNINYVY